MITIILLITAFVAPMLLLAYLIVKDEYKIDDKVQKQ